MFGKLIKNEIKSTAHTIGLIYIVAAIAIGLMAMAYIFKINWISAAATVVLAVAAGAAILVTFFMVIVNFQKSLYSNQGYLSFSLPVTSGQLLAAKTIVSFMWMLISYIVAIAVFVGIYLYASAMVGDDVKAAARVLMAFMEGIPSGATIKKVFIFLAIYVFVLIVFLIAQLYFAITLSNTRVMQKLGVFSIVIVFFAVFIVTTVISVILTKNIPLSIVVDKAGMSLSTTVSMNTENVISFGLTGLFFDIVASVALFVATSMLMDSKVNIK